MQLDRAGNFPETATMRRHRKLSAFFILSIILASSLSLSGNAQQSPATEFMQRPDLTGTRGGNLIAAVSADPPTFNRMLTALIAHTTVIERTSADLFHVNRITHELEPALAKSWEVDKSGCNYTIHLRKGVRFSDGSPFTADDVVFTFQVLQNPKTSAILSGQLMVGGAFPKVAKVDSYTLCISFESPIGMGLRMLDSIPILPKSRLLKAYQAGTLASAWGPTVSPSEVVGLGPFRLKEYERGIKIVLERNPFYWKKDKSRQTLPYLDAVTFIVIQDRNAEALRFQAGETDVIEDTLTPENYANLRRSPQAGRYLLQDLGPGLRTDFLWFNLNHGKNQDGKSHVNAEKQALFEQTEFRRAVSYALDRTGMVRSILFGLGTAQYGPISSGNKVWYHAGIERTEYDPARAQKILAGIGLKDGNNDGFLDFGSNHSPLEINLFTVRGDVTRERMAQVIRDNLARIGIRANIQLFLPNELGFRLARSFDYEAILFGFTPTDVTPDLQTDMWYSSGGNHFWCPNQEKPARAWEATLDALTTRLVGSLESGIRQSAFMQIQELWVKEMPAIPTIAPNVLAGWSKRIGNIRPSILAPSLLWNAEELTKQ
jgi:peptide/nickel transport system substrate-binding protein